MTPTDRQFALARIVACRRCKTHVGMDCMAPTGLQASDPCPVRLADARAAAGTAAA